jgi:hypothetical protein
MTLRTDIQYVAPGGNLTQAGYQALKGELAADRQISRVNLQPGVLASGTTVDFTGIPSWVNRVTMIGNSISTNGTTRLRINLGDGAYVTTGYLGAVTQIDGAVAVTANATAGVLITENHTAAMSFRFSCTIERRSALIWVMSGTGAFSNIASTTIFANQLTLAGDLDRVRLSAGGTDTFDAGAVAISWE